MNITGMQEKHLPALAELEKQCFHAPWSEKMLREELGGGIFLVAEQDGEVQGYVGCQTVLDEGYITNVAVSPDFRRRGGSLETYDQLVELVRDIMEENKDEDLNPQSFVDFSAEAPKI